MANDAQPHEPRGSASRALHDPSSGTEPASFPLPDPEARSDQSKHSLGAPEVWRSLFRNSPVGHVLLDLEGRYLQVNPALAAMIGVAPEELIGQTVAEVLPSLWQDLEPHFRRVIERGERAEFDVAGVTPADPANAHQWLVEYYPVEGPGGELVGVGGAVLDRSEARRAQAQLAARERQQEATAELGALALGEHDLTEITEETVQRVALTLGTELTAILELSASQQELIPAATRGWDEDAARTLRIERNDACPETLCLDRAELVVVEDLATDDRFTRPSALATAGAVSGMCAPIPGRDGHFGVLAVFSTSPRSFTPDDASFLTTCANILASAVERIRFEDTEHYFSTMSEALVRSRDLPQMLDAISRIAVPTLGEECWIHLRDVAVSEVGDPIATDPRWVPPAGLLPPIVDRLYLVPTLAQPALAAEEVLDYARELLQHGFGSLILAPLTARGRLLGSVAIASRTSTRQFGSRVAVLAEGFMRRASFGVDNALLLRQAEQAGRIREQFIALASHELRSPLTNVLGFAELLASRLDAEPDEVAETFRDDVRTIQSEAGRMWRTLELFLSMARLEGKQVEPARASVDLNELLTEEVLQLRLRAPAVVVRLHLPEDPPPILSDADRLREVAANLLDNAAKYGGVPPAVDVTLEMLDDTALIRVRDNGPGISDSDQVHIFERAYRGLVPQAVGGSGLGLYICKLIADSLGAELTFETSPQGTEFRLAVPRSPAELPPTTPRHGE